MSIFDRIRAWSDQKRRNRLESDLQVIAQKPITYNPKYYRTIDIVNPEKEFTLSIEENLTWFIGKPRLLRRFYTSNQDLTLDLNFFWAKSPSNYRKVHSGVPKNISRKMATILFGGGFTNEIEVYKTDSAGNVTNQIDQKVSKFVMENLEIYKDKCEFNSKLQGGATTESWSGHFFAKYSYDLELSSYAILELVDIRNAEVIKKRGLTTAIIFKNYYQKGERTFIHKETYTTNSKNEAMILNNLFAIMQDGREREVPLITLEETATLPEEFTFEGLTGMLAFEKPNKLPNNDFLDTPYGASDYAGAHSSFDALDETLSEIYAEIRNNKTIRYIPETFLKLLEDGDVKAIDDFIVNYVKISGSHAPGTDDKIDITQIPDKQDSLDKKWRIAITTVCNNAGINPIALGVTGLESITASEGSQQERNKATLETRNDKLKVWQPVIESMLLQLLALNSWMQTKLNVNQEGLSKVDIDFSNCNINVKFGDYITETEKEKIDKWVAAKMSGLTSTRNALKEIHPDWSEQKIDQELNEINFEKGMTLDNPMNLPKLDGKVDDKDLYDEDVDEEEKPLKKVLEDGAKTD